jgi:very-short-patch-repair endonuclease
VDRWGLWTHAELDAAGVPRSTVRDRVRRGSLVRVLPGVFSAGELDGRGMARAVTLWRPDAVLSHRTALWLWGLHPQPDGVEATVPRRTSVRTPHWVVLHRRDLPADARSTAWGLPVVTIERALLDGLAVVHGLDADLLVDRSLGHELNPHVVVERMERDGKRRGRPAARRQLAQWPGIVDSEPERLLGRALRARGWRLETGARVIGGYRVDFLHRPTSTAVEVDGRQFHSDPTTFVRDRWRQNAIQRGGLLVLRYAAASVLADVDGVAEDVLAALGERPRRPWPSS